MAKESVENNVREAKPSGLAKLAKKLLFLIVLAGLVVFFVQNPELRQKIASWAEPKETAPAVQEKTPLQKELDAVWQQMGVLRDKMPVIDAAQLERLGERFDALEKNNVNIIDSKADIAALVGLTGRVDKLEAALEKAVKVTDESALVLTAVMLVKDSAEQGGVFEYEAEILQQITADNASLKEPVAKIIALAKSGINSRAYLQYSFEDVYKAICKKQKKVMEEGLTWKERLNAKLGELVQVKKTNQQEKETEAGLEVIRRLVAAGELSKALRELQLSANVPLLENPAMEKWFKQAQEREAFDRAVSRIAASSLALMKINFIKKEQ